MNKKRRMTDSKNKVHAFYRKYEVDIYFWNINLNDLCINSFFNAKSRGGKTHINSVVVEIELQDGPL